MGAVATSDAQKAAVRTQMQMIINLILNGLTLREAVDREDITITDFHRRLGSDRELGQAYARAVEIKADLLAEETIALSDSDEDPAKVRNQISTRQWLASKWNKKYGDRIDVSVTQTLDIASTLAEARARLLPGRFQHTIENVHTVDSIGIEQDRTLDNQSNRVVDVPGPDDVPDIFS